MNLSVFYILLAACAALMVVERLGVPTTLALNFKGDLKRETRWLAQYGQAVCTLVVALLVWRLDDATFPPTNVTAPSATAAATPPATATDHPATAAGHPGAWVIVLAAVFGTSIVSLLIKRLLGRVRPGREQAGRFLGPTFRHANFRESFPSSHSACAVALSVVLAAFYPRGAEIFWTLAITCAVLRYLMDAHWPSDVLGGIALGYGLAYLALERIPPIMAR